MKKEKNISCAKKRIFINNFDWISRCANQKEEEKQHH